MEFLTHPVVIIVIVLAFVVGNIMLLKYTANMKWGEKSQFKSKRLDAFDEMTQKSAQLKAAQHPQKNSTKNQSSSGEDDKS